MKRLHSRLRSSASQLSPDGFAPASLALDFLGTSNTLDNRITFSRGSQATLTDSTGKLTYAPNNLLLNSENFEASSWIVDNGGGFNPVITSNSGVAPNGTTTADRVVINRGTGTFSRLAQSVIAVPSVTYIFSVWMRTFSGGTANVGLRLDLTGINCAVTANWQRFFISAPASVGTISSQILSFTSIPGTDATADILVWGAQLEAVTYQTTPGTYNSTTPKNLLGYTQEIDNAAWTKSNAFVQTNLLLRSEELGTSWTASSATVTSNSTVAPNGTLTADTLVSSGTGGRLTQNVTAPTTGSYTASVYVQAGTVSTFELLLRNNNTATNIAQATFNLANGTVSATTAGTAAITNVGGGWYRVSVTSSGGVTAADLLITYLYAGSSSNASGNSVILWGAQLVRGAVAGDYQRTDASAAAVQYTAPDGTLSADNIVTTSANSAATQTVTASTTASYVGSVYIKYVSGSQNVRLRLALTGGTAVAKYVAIDAVTGALVASDTTYTITDAGNGWWRISAAIANNGTNTSALLQLYATNDTVSTNSILVWGAQLSNSASLDPYVYNPGAAPTSTAYYGPRFDYDPVTLAPKGLLIEEQRTNSLTYSNTFSNAVWVKENLTVAQNVSCPDGTTSGWTITNDATNGLHRVYFDYLTALSAVRSVYVKAGTASFVGISASGTDGSVFNLSTGAKVADYGSAVGSIQDAGNGWYRISTVPSTANRYLIIGIGETAAQAIPGTSYAGTSKTILIFGAQLEVGAFATSYIPTVASTVTRSADVALMTGDNFRTWYNLNEGVFGAEADTTQSSANRILEASSGTSSRVVDLNVASTAVLQMYNGTTAFNASGTITLNTPFKAAGAYKTANYAAVLNGGTVAVNSDALVNTANALQIGRFNAGSNYLNGHIRRITYYPQRLPDYQLQRLTA